ncbi:MAG TPA: hypothetical protein IAA03_04380, partial [Candidatus Ruminococcus avistercoris]|nr:hypothetical protein [Candidatus Ruminococcus avistercoris]
MEIKNHELPQSRQPPFQTIRLKHLFTIIFFQVKALLFPIGCDTIFLLQTDGSVGQAAFLPRIIPTTNKIRSSCPLFYRFAQIFFAFSFTEADFCSIMKGECDLTNTKKNLSDLTLLDRFLFAEAVEDPE